MKRDSLNKIAQSFFDNNKELKAIYGTEKGHFFYERDSRQQFLNKGDGTDKPVDFKRGFAEAAERAAKDKAVEGILVGVPGRGILIAEGLTTVEAVKEVFNLTTISGVTPEMAKDIKAFLKTLN